MGNDNDEKSFNAARSSGQKQSNQLYDQFLGIGGVKGEGFTTLGGGNAGLHPPIMGPSGPQPGIQIPNMNTGFTGGGLYGERNTARSKADDLYKQMLGSFSGFEQTGGVNPDDISRLRGLYTGEGGINSTSGGGGGGGGGNPGFNLGGSAFEGINIPGFGESMAGYRDFSRTGGVDMNKLNEALTGFRGLSGSQGGFGSERLGSISSDANALRDTDYSGIERQSMLDQEKTGGYSNEDIANVRRRAASSGSSIYSSLADRMGREKAVSGMSPGMSGANFKLARQAAQDSNTAQLESEIGLGDSIRKGKFDASSKLSDLALSRIAEERANRTGAAGIDLDTQRLIDATRLQALGGIQQGNFQNESLISSNKLAGFGGLRDTEGMSSNLAMARAGGLDSFNLNKAGLELSASAAGGARADQSKREQAAMEQWLMEMGQQGRQFGASSLLDLYKSSPGEVMDYNDLIMRGLGQRDTSNLNWTGLMPGSKKGGGGSNTMNNISTGADIAATGLDIWDRYRRQGQSGSGGTTINR